MSSSSGARLAALASACILLLLVAMAWRMSAPPGAPASIRAPHELSSKLTAEGVPPGRKNGDSRSSLARAPAPGRQEELAESKTLADEIASMTSQLGEELEKEIQGAFATEPPKSNYPEEWLKGPPFTVGGIEGHYVNCGDSVANGALGQGVNGDLDKVRRFHGQVDQVFAIRCPAHCGRYLSFSLVYGCGPYLDASAICMAAIMDHKIGYETGGDVIIKLVPPVPTYESCYREVKRYMDVAGASQLVSERGRGDMLMPPYKKTWTTSPFKFPEWEKADGAARLTEGSYDNNKALLTYRTTCSYPEVDSDLGCAGKRAFVIMNYRADGAGLDPVISPPGGTLQCPLLISINAPHQRIYYTDDGTSVDHEGEPNDAATRYTGPFYASKPGPLKVCTAAYSDDSFPPNSKVVCEEYVVTEPELGCKEGPKVVEQESLPPRIEAHHQQYFPGKATVLAPSSVHNALIPGEQPNYQLFFAVGATRDEVSAPSSHSLAEPSPSPCPPPSRTPAPL